MRKAAVWLLAAACVSAGAAAVEQDDVPRAFLGTWKGKGQQSNQDGFWSIAATIAPGRSGEIVGTITYPSAACGGDLILRAARPDRLEVREDITFGDCADGGLITLTPQDGGLRYHYRFRPGIGADADSAWGTVARAR